MVNRKLVLGDDLTEDRFEYMRDHLAEALLVSDSVVLELRGINKADQTLIKLICGTHRVAESMGKSFSLFTGETRRTVCRLAERTGYATLPCAIRNRGCLYEDKKP